MARPENQDALESYTGEASFANKRVAIVVAEWNADINEVMYADCLALLEQASVGAELPDSKLMGIVRIDVPGAFELTYGAEVALKWSHTNHPFDAVICIGTLIKGETKHDEYIAQAVANGLTQLAIAYFRPVLFGVLTVDSKPQAIARVDGSVGRKGAELAASALKLMQISPASIR